MLFVISLLIPIVSFSQDTLTTITPTQLKTINLIFAEHEKWSYEVPLLNDKIKNLSTIIQLNEKQDSLKSKQITILDNQVKLDEKNIKNLNKKNKVLKFSTFGSIFALIITLLLR